MVTIVAFDRKGDLVESERLCRQGLPLFVFSCFEIVLAMLQPIVQPVTKRTLTAFINITVQLLATQFRLYASRRLMLDTLHLLFRRVRQGGTWPTLSEWIDCLEKINVPAMSRYGQYKEALLFSLKGLYYELGDVLDYAASDFLERLFVTPGCFVINTSGISVESASLLASLLINHAYESRADADISQCQPIFFVLDDALPIVHGGTAAESEGGINPMSNWSMMGRSRRIGMIVAVQNFSLISPALRNNTDTICCFGSTGRDAEELSRHLNLTREQAAVLPVMRPGEVVVWARSVHPLAVYGRQPEMP